MLVFIRLIQLLTMVEVTIKERGIISPALAKRFFPDIPIKEVQAAARRQVKAQKIREATGKIIRAGKKPSIKEFKERGVTTAELKEFGLVREVPIPTKAPPEVILKPPEIPFVPPTIKPPTMPTDIRVTAIGARFPRGFESLPPKLETRFEREERKKFELEQLAMVFERRFERPIREKLGTLPEDVGAPFQAKILTEAIVTAGRPLSLVLGPPEIREETAKFLSEFPEEIFKAGVGVAAVVTVPPLIIPFIGAPVVKKFREGKPEEAFGVLAGELALIGTALAAQRALRAIPKPVGKPLKGVVKPTPPKLKLKKKITITEKRLLAQLAKKAREPPQPPRITNVIRKDGEITIIVKSAGKVVDRRRLLEGITPKGVIEAQLRVAKAQGAKFSGIRPPTVLPEAPLIPRIAVSRFPPIKAPKAQLRLQRQLSAQLRALGLVQVLDITALQKQRQRELQKQLQVSGISQAQLSAQAQKQAQSQKQLELQLQGQFQAQAQAQSEAQAETAETILGPEIAKPRVPRKKPPKRPRIPILPPPILPPALERPEVRPPVRIRREGYDAIAKVKGKPRKIADNVSRISALSIGSEFVDQTPAASFTIKPTGRVASGGDILNWESRKFKFRPPIRRGKPVKSEIIIEKNRFRIDSPGEIAGIPEEAKRLREAGLQPRKIKKNKTGEIDLMGML